MKAGCNSLELKRLDYAELKRNLRQRTIRGVPGGVNNWECETCGRVLLSKAGYVNHIKPHASSQALMPFTPVCLLGHRVTSVYCVMKSANPHQY